MPTKNRRHWVEQSLLMFQQQTYRERELIILDDGDDNLFEVCTGIPGVIYDRMNSECSTGEKRNIACEMANGEYIVHWDDDDIQHVDRLTRQMTAMRKKWWVDVNGVDQAYYLDERNGKTYWYQYCLQPLPPFVLGNSLCYRRDFWNEKRFEHVSHNEDMRFQFKDPRPTIDVLLTPLLVGRVVAGNMNGKDFSSPVWCRIDISRSRLDKLMTANDPFGMGRG